MMVLLQVLPALLLAWSAVQQHVGKLHWHSVQVEPWPQHVGEVHWHSLQLDPWGLECPVIPAAGSGWLGLAGSVCAYVVGASPCRRWLGTKSAVPQPV